jgi:hypothetical protein
MTLNFIFIRQTVECNLGLSYLILSDVRGHFDAVISILTYGIKLLTAIVHCILVIKRLSNLTF